MKNRTLGPFIRWCVTCHRIFFDTRDWIDHKHYKKSTDKHQAHRLIIERINEYNGVKYLKDHDS